MLDLTICKTIEVLVEKLSTSGKYDLDKKLLKDLFTQAGRSAEYLKFFHERLLQQLEKEHAEIRLGTLLIIDHLFMRSEYFRNLLLEECHEFLELVIDLEESKPLPPPVPAAKKLKGTALQIFYKWYKEFGDSDVRLRIGYNFIKNMIGDEMDEAERRRADELARAEQVEERRTEIVNSRVIALRSEVEENVEEISRIVTEMDNCCGLLIPKPDNFLHAQSGDGDKEESILDLREHGVGSRSKIIKVTLEGPCGSEKIRRTEDNESIIENLKDLYLLCKNRYLPKSRKWACMVNREEDEGLYERVVNMNQMIESEMWKCEELQLFSLCKDKDDSESESESEHSDFEEVPDKEGYEEYTDSPPVPAPNPIPSTSTPKVPKPVPSWSLGEIGDRSDCQDPTTFSATLDNIMKRYNAKSTSTLSTVFPEKVQQVVATSNTDLNVSNVSEDQISSIEDESSQSSSSRKKKLLEVAPKLPFDIDLYHWEDKDLKAPSVEIPETSSHRFWKPIDRASDVIESQEGVAALRTRRIEFSGKFEPVKWSCRAPLASGKLCPRKDRVKCPFHGKIIPRNESGYPTEADDIAAFEKQKAQEELDKPPDWQDPTFLKELKEKIGVDLTIKPPTKGKAKKKTFAELYPGLTDISKPKKTAKDRLSRKIFNKASLKRIAAEMDNLTHKRFRDKFGDQFNYTDDD